MVLAILNNLLPIQEAVHVSAMPTGSTLGALKRVAYPFGFALKPSKHELSPPQRKHTLDGRVGLSRITSAGANGPPLAPHLAPRGLGSTMINRGSLGCPMENTAKYQKNAKTCANKWWNPQFGLLLSRIKVSAPFYSPPIGPGRTPY